eukprot:12465122-Prorocentrum_lima.AAC.1
MHVSLPLGNPSASILHRRCGIPDEVAWKFEGAEPPSAATGRQPSPPLSCCSHGFVLGRSTIFPIVSTPRKA